MRSTLKVLTAVSIIAGAWAGLFASYTGYLKQSECQKLAEQMVGGCNDAGVCEGVRFDNAPLFGPVRQYAKQAAEIQGCASDAPQAPGKSALAESKAFP